MFKLTRKQTNKLVNFVDKNFSYDWRSMKREGDNIPLAFVAKDNERKLLVSLSYDGWYHIQKDGIDVTRGFFSSFKEVTSFKAMILLLS